MEFEIVKPDQEKMEPFNFLSELWIIRPLILEIMLLCMDKNSRIKNMAYKLIKIIYDSIGVKNEDDNDDITKSIICSVNFQYNSKIKDDRREHYRHVLDSYSRKRTDIRENIEQIDALYNELQSKTRVKPTHKMTLRSSISRKN